MKDNLHTHDKLSEKVKVSVLLPSYNHGKFIGKALMSILQQDFDDYEIIIIDDASSDDSVIIINNLIEAYPSKKIRFIKHIINEGAVITTNQLISLSESEYIAIINSDDIWRPNKLGMQVKFLEENPNFGAVFTTAEIIGQVGISQVDLFKKENQNKGRWLRDFFFRYNSLCHSSLLIKKQIYFDLGLYNPIYNQLPDFDFWIRLCKNYEIHLIQEPLVYFRWHETNTSKPSKRTINIFNFELFMIMSSFFDEMPDDVFIEGFSDLFKNTEFINKQELNIEKAFLYFSKRTSNNSIFMKLGKIKLYNLLQNPDYEKILRIKYKFTYNELHNLVMNNRLFDIQLRNDQSFCENMTLFVVWIIRKIPFANHLLRQIRKSKVKH